jgi:hypothetical protein
MATCCTADLSFFLVAPFWVTTLGGISHFVSRGRRHYICSPRRRRRQGQRGVGFASTPRVRETLGRNLAHLRLSRSACESIETRFCSRLRRSPVANALRRPSLQARPPLPCPAPRRTRASFLRTSNHLRLRPPLRPNRSSSRQPRLPRPRSRSWSRLRHRRAGARGVSPPQSSGSSASLQTIAPS